MCINNALIWGDIPSWLSAIGTVGSLFAAFWLLKEDLGDRREARKKTLEDSVRKISCWYEETSKQNVLLWVQNLSEEPIYFLVAYMGSADANLDALPSPDNRYIEVVFGTVAPQQRINQVIDDQRHYSGSHFPDIAQVAIEFTDSKGDYWRRYEHGEIKKIKYRRPFD